MLKWLATYYPDSTGEYDDELGFLEGTSYGTTVAKIFANPFAEEFFTTPADIRRATDGAVMAIVDVTGPATPAYTRLGLLEGRNCVWITEGTGGNDWDGYVTQPQRSGAACAKPNFGTNKFPVKEAKSGHEVVAAARFTEDTDKKPAIGFSCLREWCDLYADPTKPPAVPHDGDQVDNEKEWKDKSWHDEEELAEFDGTTLTRTGVKASIVPQKINNHKLVDFNTKGSDGLSVVGSLAAKIKVKGLGATSTSKYFTKWGLRDGINELWITLTDDGKWGGYVKRPDGSTQAVAVVLHPHDPSETHRAKKRMRAHWIWKPTDQAGWTDCDVGCCEVSGFM